MEIDVSIKEIIHNKDVEEPKALEKVVSAETYSRFRVLNHPTKEMSNFAIILGKLRVNSGASTSSALITFC